MTYTTNTNTSFLITSNTWKYWEGLDDFREDIYTLEDGDPIEDGYYST